MAHVAPACWPCCLRVALSTTLPAASALTRSLAQALTSASPPRCCSLVSATTKCPFTALLPEGEAVPARAQYSSEHGDVSGSPRLPPLLLLLLLNLLLLPTPAPAAAVSRLFAC